MAVEVEVAGCCQTNSGAELVCSPSPGVGRCSKGRHLCQEAQSHPGKVSVPRNWPLRSNVCPSFHARLGHPDVCVRWGEYLLAVVNDGRCHVVAVTWQPQVVTMWDSSALGDVSPRPLKGEKEPSVPTADLEKGLRLCSRWGADRCQILPLCPFPQRRVLPPGARDPGLDVHAGAQRATFGAWW